MASFEYLSPRLTVYYYAHYPAEFVPEPNALANVRWSFAGTMSDGAFVIGAVDKDDYIHLRAPGNTSVATLQRSIVRPVIHNGVLHYENNGTVHTAAINYTALAGGTGPVLGTPTDTGVAVPGPGLLAYNGSQYAFLYLDDGGLRVALQNGSIISPKRLYPAEPYKRIDKSVRAAIEYTADGRVYAFMTDANGNVLGYRYDGAFWSVQHYAHRGDLSEMRVTDLGVYQDRLFYAATYKRTEEYDTGTGDWLLALVTSGELFAMYPFAAYAQSMDADAWVSFTIGHNTTDGYIVYTDFNTTSVALIPAYMHNFIASTLPAPTQDYTNDASIVSLDYNEKSWDGNITLRIKPDSQLAANIKRWDILRVEMYRRPDDAAPEFARFIVVSDVTTIYRGEQKFIQATGKPYAYWLIANTRMPHYVELRGGEGVFSDTVGNGETLYGAPGSRKTAHFNRYIFPFGMMSGRQPRITTADTGIEFGGSVAALGHVGVLINTTATSPIAKVYQPLEPRLSLENNATQLTIRLRGWSLVEHFISLKLYIEGEDEAYEYTVPGGPWKWNEPAGNYPIEITIPASAIRGGISAVEVAFEEDPSITPPTWIGNTWAGHWGYIASIEFEAPMRVEYTHSMRTWKGDDDRKQLVLDTQNAQAGMFSIAPYSPDGVFTAASFLLDNISVNDGTIVRYGLIWGALDVQNSNLVYVETDGSMHTLVIATRRGGREYRQVEASINELPYAIALRYEGGLLEVFKVKPGLRELPGTLLTSYEWRAYDGEIFPEPEERHVGIYGEILSPSIAIISWARIDDKVCAVSVDAANVSPGQSYTLPGNRILEVRDVTNKGMFDGPFELRNLWNWKAKYSENGYSGWAVEFRKHCWDCINEASVYSRPVSTSQGNYWRGRHVDFHPFITTAGQRNDLPGRVRYYSDDIRGVEPVGLETACVLGGYYICGRLYVETEEMQGQTYISPPEIASLKTQKRIRCSAFLAHELWRPSLQDALRYALGIAGIEQSVFIGNPTSNLPGGDVWL